MMSTKYVAFKAFMEAGGGGDSYSLLLSPYIKFCNQFTSTCKPTNHSNQPTVSLNFGNKEGGGRAKGGLRPLVNGPVPALRDTTPLRLRNFAEKLASPLPTYTQRNVRIQTIFVMIC